MTRSHSQAAGFGEEPALRRAAEALLARTEAARRPVTAEAIAAAGPLSLIIRAGAGTNNIDKEAASAAESTTRRRPR